MIMGAWSEVRGGGIRSGRNTHCKVWVEKEKQQRRKLAVAEFNDRRNDVLILRTWGGVRHL